MKEKEVRREVAERNSAISTSHSIIELVAESANSLEKVVASKSNDATIEFNKKYDTAVSFLSKNNETNKPFLLRNVVKNAIFGFKNLVAKTAKDTTNLLNRTMPDAFSNLTNYTRQVAKLSTVGFLILFLSVSNLYSQTTKYIVGNPAPNSNQIDWDRFVWEVANLNGGQGNTYILTDDVGTPNSTIRNTPVTSPIGEILQLFCPYF